MSIEKKIKLEIWDWLHSTESLTDFQNRMTETYGEDYQTFLRERSPYSAESKSLLSRLVYDVLTSTEEDEAVILRPKQRIEICPICGHELGVGDRSWVYRCPSCGSQIHQLGIWVKKNYGQNWDDLTDKEKRDAGDEFFKVMKARKDGTSEWKDVVFKI